MSFPFPSLALRSSLSIPFLLLPLRLLICSRLIAILLSSTGPHCLSPLSSIPTLSRPSSNSKLRSRSASQHAATTTSLRRHLGKIREDERSGKMESVQSVTLPAISYWSQSYLRRRGWYPFFIKDDDRKQVNIMCVCV